MNVLLHISWSFWAKTSESRKLFKEFTLKMSAKPTEISLEHKKS